MGLPYRCLESNLVLLQMSHNHMAALHCNLCFLPSIHKGAGFKELRNCYGDTYVQVTLALLSTS